MIKGLLHVKFAKYSWDARSNSTIQTFIGDKNQIQNLSPLNKSILRLRNNLFHDRAYMIGKNLGYHSN